jgi:uncharacterized SAM-binding protein YcdF (DUF218 family)
MLKRAGVTHILLVTNGWHMPRAQRNFEIAAAPAGIRIEPAPMGLARRLQGPALAWIPSSPGATHVRDVLREAIGRLAGA